MLFTVLEEYNKESILNEVLLFFEEKNIDRSVLNIELSENYTIENALTEVIFLILDKAAEKDKKEYKQRQKIGIEEAMKNGVRFGRPKSKRPKRFETVKQMYENKSVTCREAGRILGVSGSTFLRWLKEDKETDKI